MEKRIINENYRRIAEKLINEKPELAYIKDSNVKIIYLESDYAKKTAYKVVYGECEKVQSKNQWAIDADFTITLYQPNIFNFTMEQIEILLFHELLHVGIEQKEGKENYSIVPHDLEDFKIIIDKYGTNWNQC